MHRIIDFGLFAILLILIGIPTGYAIHCYVCNSHAAYDGLECWDLTQESNTSALYKDCDFETPPPGKKFERCRVVLQTVEDDTRIIRSCATWPDRTAENQCKDRTGTNKVKQRSCECDYNGCNSAYSLLIGPHSNWARFLVATGVAVITYLRAH